jgi:predicted nucleotide-binding protein
MAKRIIQPQIQEQTELVISKEELNSKLTERIGLGAGLFNTIINTQPEFSKLKRDFSDWSDYNSEFLKQSFNKEYNEYKKSYDDSGNFIGIMQREKSPAIELQNFKDRIHSKIDNLKKLKTKSELLKTNVKESLEVKVLKTELNKNEVFIVHGHDEEAKTKTARFIEKLGFKPIILHEQASSSQTVIEKIETYSNVGFGIVLYTPCDVGAKKDENPNYKNRARQNVVFEHGFLIGKIGRENVCALIKDEIETPNDISGVVYIKMDNEEAWHLKLARELRNSGYEVDMNKL